jgi:hypothetical protein
MRVITPSIVIKSMKAIFTIIGIILLSNSLLTQCPTSSTGTIYFDKNDIDNFPTKYPDCTEIDATLIIADRKITSLSNLGQLRGVTGSLIIRDCDRLKTLDGLDGMLYVNGNIQIESNDSLEALYAFNDKNFTSVGGELSFLDNPGLTTLEGFQYLTHIYAEGEFAFTGLWFFKNPSLKHVNELSHLQYVGREISFSQCDQLENITGLSGIRELAEDFSIHYAASLKNLNGIHNLESVGGNVFISHTGLENLDGFSKLTHIGGSLSILFNDYLTSIEGLSNLDPGSLQGDREGYHEHLEIEFNPLLSDCSILPICNMLVRDDITFEIQYNAEGCNSDAEVLDNCSSTSVNDIDQVTFISYPNPTDGSLLIESNRNSRAIILDIHGRKLMQLNVSSGLNEYDVSSLPSGKYIIRTESGNSMKIVIQ